MYEGVEYDYVFDVDIQEGVPPLKLPFNANGSFCRFRFFYVTILRIYNFLKENPYEAAQKFLIKYELPSSYTDQIVEFIDKNTGGVSFGSRAADAYSNEKSAATTSIVSNLIMSQSISCITNCRTFGFIMDRHPPYCLM